MMDPGLPKLSEQWICPVCAGLVSPCYFQTLIVALTCTSWSFDTVLIKVWLFVFICCLLGEADGHLVLHGHGTFF